MKSILKHYAAIVPFLGELMGETCEVALQDLSKDKNCIVAIANGHVSGRSVGSPLTNYGLQMASDELWREKDYYCNYAGRTRDGKLLRSSTYFIKEGGQLLGMLCFNSETQHIQALSEAILRLGGMPLLQHDTADSEDARQFEHFYESIEDIVDSVLQEYFSGSALLPERLAQNERFALVQKLDEKGVFMLKGAVGSVAVTLRCSEATVYRYLSVIRKMGKSRAAPRVIEDMV